MTGRGRPASHQATHECLQANNVKRRVLEVDLQVVGPCLRLDNAVVVSQLACAYVVDRLTGFPEFNDLVDAGMFVLLVG